MKQQYSIGDTWSELTLLRIVDKTYTKNKDGKREGLFRCSCGCFCQRVIYYVCCGRIKSCGCINRTRLAPKKMTKKERPDKKSPCPVCGKLKTKSAKMCQSCKVSTFRQSPDFRTRSEYSAEWHRMRNYGIDSGGFDLLWIVAKGKCNICGCDLTLPTPTKGQPLSTAVIDHNHDTGNIRGLLCNACNKGIGLLKDNPEIIYSAWRWVKND